LDAGPDPYAPRPEVSDAERDWLEKPELFQYMQDSRLDWQYWTEPQPGLNGRSVFCPRGRLVGGTSTFIAGLCVRGHPSDYDGWARAGNPGWAYADLRPYFLRSERNRRAGIDPAWHGTAGPQTVRDLGGRSAAVTAFLEACAGLGYPRNDDFNGPVQE